MKKLGFIVFIVTLIIGLTAASAFSWGRVPTGFFKFSFGRVSGSGNIVTQNRNVGGFTKIESSNNLVIEAVTGRDYSVSVEGDDNLTEFIETRTVGDVLEIKMKKRYKSSNPLVVRVTAPEIRAVDLSGASRINLTTNGEKDLVVDLTGASRATVSGTVDSLKLDLSGSSKVDATALQSSRATVDASGASEASVNVINELAMHLSGKSKLDYLGKPNISSQSISGKASVRER